MYNDIPFFQINESKAVLIAGNGPSLGQIDYNRLPKEFDIFRCNQFYLEEEYFVGKKIKAAFFHHHMFFEQQATLFHLQENREYECEHVVCSDFESSLIHTEKIQALFRYFPNTINAFELYQQKLPSLASFTLANALFKEQVMTSGVIMVLTAAAMGYHKIYIAGMDFYVNNKHTYAFNSHRPNLMKLMPNFKRSHNSISTWHSAQTDIGVLKRLQELYGVELYSVSPASPLSEYFSLAPKTDFGEQNRQQLYFPKPEDCLKDIIIPQSSFYKFFCNKYYDNRLGVSLKNNLIYRLLYNLFRLPSDIKKYLRYKYLNR